MPKTKFLTDLVFNMDNKGFELLQEVIAARNNKERYGVSNFVELAIKYNRVLGVVAQIINQAVTLHKGYIDICVMSVAVDIL